MDQKLKERLAGATVLVLLFVILIPLLLDDASEVETRITTTNIPKKPQAEFTTRLMPIPEPEEFVPAEAAAAPAQVAVEADGAHAGETEAAPEVEAVPATEVAPKKATPETAGLTGWVVQVGSFSRKNADNLNERLRAAGYASYVVDDPVKARDGSLLYRVRIGPEVLRSEALKLKAEIKKEMGLDGLVLNYP